MTTTAKIAAKGTSNTGITEDLAKRCHDQLGRKVLAVVELVAESRSEKRNGDESVSLSIVTLEPAPDATTEEHLRELARSFYYERQLAEGSQPTLDGDDIEPDLKTVLAAGEKHRPHPYVSSTLSVDDNAVCDVCGHHESAALHADRSGLDDPFTLHAVDDPDDEEEGDDEPDPDDEVDPYDRTHSTTGAAPGADTACGLRATFGKNLHTHADRDRVNCPECLSTLEVVWDSEEAPVSGS